MPSRRSFLLTLQRKFFKKKILSREELSDKLIPTSVLSFFSLIIVGLHNAIIFSCKCLAVDWLKTRKSAFICFRFTSSKYSQHPVRHVQAADTLELAIVFVPFRRIQREQKNVDKTIETPSSSITKINNNYDVKGRQRKVEKGERLTQLLLVP